LLRLLYEIERNLGKNLSGKFGLRFYQMLSLVANYSIAIYYRMFWCCFKRKGIVKNKNKNEKELIVSLTTFPSRINIVWICIETIMRQTHKPDRIILWLAKEQFDDESKLPAQVLKLKERGLEIKFCNDLKPHKKYYYTMLDNPDATVITFDDDVLYPPYTIERLINASNNYPECIICNRGHIITFNETKIAPYSLWVRTSDIEIEPNLLLCPTGVGGVLYPPKSLDEAVFDKEGIITNCLMADDLWLKVMSIRKGTKVVKTSKFPRNLFVLMSSQKNSLGKKNVGNNQNDKQLSNILSNYTIDIENLKKYSNKTS
jgi:hypothetical protein